MKMLFLLTKKAKLESKIYKHFSIFSLVEFLQKSAASLSVDFSNSSLVFNVPSLVMTATTAIIIFLTTTFTTSSPNFKV